jgi:hypothetical protein
MVTIQRADKQAARLPQRHRSSGRARRAIMMAWTTASTEVLARQVEHVTFQNKENGFSVLPVKVRGQRDLVTVPGHAATISSGGIRPGQQRLGR